MKFNNKENERIILPDERIIWLSRSCAVVVTVWCIVKNTPSIVITDNNHSHNDRYYTKLEVNNRINSLITAINGFEEKITNLFSN